jgi:hypothetical protein
MAMALAKAKTGQAKAKCFGLAWNVRESKPFQAGQISGQGKAGNVEIKVAMAFIQDSLHFDGPSADLTDVRLAEVGRGSSTGLVEGQLAYVG